MRGAGSLTIGRPGDRFEREAEAVADQVGERTPGASGPAVGWSLASVPIRAATGGAGSGAQLQRACASCEQEKRAERPAEIDLQASSDGELSAGPELIGAIDAARGGGRPLGADERSFYDEALGHDFSSVRIHADTRASALSRSLGARAFTVGSDIFFASRAPALASREGRRLMTHELAHTVQQGAAQPSSAPRGGGTPALQLSRVDRGCIQRETDADIESGTGVGAAITAGTMTTDPSIHQQTIAADGCFGRDDCRIRFQFRKAYKGDYNYVGGGGTAVRGVYVRIDAHASPECGDCPQQPMIQVLRFITKNAAGDVEAADPQDPGRRDRAGWNDPKSRSRGWGLDVPVSNTTQPYVTSQWTSHPGTATAPAVLRDTPGHWATDRNVGMEFESCLMCKQSAGSVATSLGCVRWGFYTDAAGTISFRPAVPVAYCGVTQPLNDATLRFGQIAGNTPARADFRQQPPAP